MNPSTDDILHAVDAVPAEIVFVLPNKQEYHHGCRAGGSSLRGEKVIVVPTKTIRRVFRPCWRSIRKPSRTASWRLPCWTRAKHVRSGSGDFTRPATASLTARRSNRASICRCARVSCAPTARKPRSSRSWRARWYPTTAFATVIFGEGVTEEQAAEVENLLHKENKEMEINVIDGGQPVYYYIISVE